LTASEWPSSGSPCGAPMAASQSRTVLSREPDATSLPSGEKATDQTASEWPSSGSPCEQIYPTVRSPYAPYFPSQGGDAPTIIAENHDKSSPSSTTILPLIPLTMLNLLRNKQQVSPAPYIFFHSPSGHWWEEGTDPILLNCRSINEEAVQHLLSSLSVNVSKPGLRQMALRF
jgi:hypothetical protein